MFFVQDDFTIYKIFWERIFLNIYVETGYPDKVDFYIKSEKGKEYYIDSILQGEGRYCIRLNIACVYDRSFLENGRWYIVVKLPDKTEKKCFVSTEVAYGFDDLSRIFRYAENQMAYTLSFGIVSFDDKRLVFYMDSFFMFENSKWRRRRYIREVRDAGAKLKRLFMFASIIMIRIYYHLIYILIPKNGNRVMIMSETKKNLWGNLKSIDERIKERGLDKRFKITYSYRNTAGNHQKAKDILSWMRVVTKIAAQDVIFVDDYAPVFGFFRLGKKTKLVQVWHAGEGFKSVGYSRFGKDGSPFPQGSCHKQYTHVITGSKHLSDVFQEVFAVESSAFYPLGMARLDSFLDEAIIDNFKNEFYEKYPYLKNKKIILFAPTYRGADQKDAYYDCDKIDLNRIGKFCREKGWVFLIKMHPFVGKSLEIPEEYSKEIYEFSDYHNINELYYITDLLITDYSSNYFEYALMRRPVVFYTYDREIYELTRGVHRNVKDNAPGKVCDTFEELMECLENQDFETWKIEKFADENFKEYDGKAADKIIDEILVKKGSENE